MRPARPILALACTLFALTACDGMFTSPSAGKETKHQRRAGVHRAQPVAKPEVTSPASHKTCTETFKLEVGTPRYTKCIASLSELEAK